MQIRFLSCLKKIRFLPVEPLKQGKKVVGGRVISAVAMLERDFNMFNMKLIFATSENKLVRKCLLLKQKFS